jgi:membrane protease YdiL (CAAX protease family)
MLEQGDGLEARHEPTRNVQLVEVTVFLFLIVPSMALSFLAARQVELRFMEVAVSSILNNLGLLSLVLYFVWRNDESLRKVGWSFDHPGRDAAWGLILFVPLFFSGNLIETVLEQAGFSGPSRRPSFLAVSGLTQVVGASIMVIVVAVAEETIFRGYLLLRLKAVMGTTTAAVVFSSLIFSLGHGYQGTAGAITVFVLGVVLALVYLWRSSLVAPMVIHLLTDFTSIVLPALLQQ